MKCSLCGGEWISHWPKSWEHPKNGCLLSCVEVRTAGNVEAINAAIEAAKVDKRKSEECKHCETCWRIVQEQAESGIEDPSSCPCAAFEKEKV